MKALAPSFCCWQAYSFLFWSSLNCYFLTLKCDITLFWGRLIWRFLPLFSFCCWPDYSCPLSWDMTPLHLVFVGSFPLKKDDDDETYSSFLDMHCMLSYDKLSYDLFLWKIIKKYYSHQEWWRNSILSIPIIVSKNIIFDMTCVSEMGRRNNCLILCKMFTV